MRDNLFAQTQLRMYKNMPDLVAESLKTAIIRGEFKGGIQLKQDEIAKQFDVSLIPVREALIQLENMHLVQCIRNKGAMVTTLSLKEMRQLFELRKVLEIGTIKLMKMPLKEGYLEKMSLLVNKIEQTEDVFMLSKYNRLFYLLLCESVENKELNDMYEKLFVRIERYLNYIFFAVPTLRESKTHYGIVLQLIRNNEKEALANRLQEHIEETEQAFIAYLAQSHLNGETLDWNYFLPFQ